VPDVFISHASEDKADVARPLANALVEAGMEVWLDEGEITLGDSLRAKIEHGLASCRFAAVVLSPDFLEKSWTQAELDGLIAIEHASGEKRILPVWHNLDEAAVAMRAPILAGRFAISTAEGTGAMCEAICRAVGQPQASGAELEPIHVPVDKAAGDAIGRFLNTVCHDLVSDSDERHRLGSVLLELVANAYDHGGAGSALLSRFGGTLVLSDDGGEFNPLGAELADGVGLRMLSTFARDFDDLRIDYVPASASGGSYNELVIRFAASADGADHCTVALSSSALTRFHEFRASPGRFVHIPAGCGRYSLDLCEAHRTGPLMVSGIRSVLMEILRRLPPESTLLIQIDQDWMEEILAQVILDERVQFLRKAV